MSSENGNAAPQLGKSAAELALDASTTFKGWYSRGYLLHLEAVIKYIHENPVTAGLCTNAHS
jgi:hypothetical protein